MGMKVAVNMYVFISQNVAKSNLSRAQNNIIVGQLADMMTRPNKFLLVLALFLVS